MVFFVGRCRDVCEAKDQKIAAFDSSYKGGLSSMGGLVDRGALIREQARSHRECISQKSQCVTRQVD
ncbi:hypothetical protein TMM008_20050 [Pseudomonas sp. 008]|nr:hypothetical protein TMM008_20050 [Pseudomonas sp. 008]